jgi:predicted NUDIX family phosphoesterase
VADEVLAIRRTDIPKAWLQQCDYVCMPEHAFEQAISLGAQCWKPRHEIERDVTYKQLIPYILVQHDNKLGMYSRNGSETRLHACWSIGAGGHVERCDAQKLVTQTLYAAARRELYEEMPGLDSDIPLHWLGIINEEETSVGHTHLGIVFVAQATGANPPAGGEELHKLRWVSADEVKGRNLEIWSRLALDLYMQSEFA